VLVVTGPSGVGKGTLIRELCRYFPDLRLSVSATTRPPRQGEEDGRDYHFLSPEEFEKRVQRGDFLEHAAYAGNRYGTLRDEVQDGPVVLEIEVQGARQVREALPSAVQVFIAPPSNDVLRERLIGRGTDSPDTIRARLAEAEQELAAKDEFHHVIVNDDLNAAVQELRDLAATIWARPQGEART
jgi:guanylate kinase